MRRGTRKRTHTTAFLQNIKGKYLNDLNCLSFQTTYDDCTSVRWWWRHRGISSGEERERGSRQTQGYKPVHPRVGRLGGRGNPTIQTETEKVRKSPNGMLCSHLTSTSPSLSTFMVCSHCPTLRPIQTPIKKWVVKNCVAVFTLHLHNNAIEYCWNLSVSMFVSMSVSGSVNAPLTLHQWWHKCKCREWAWTNSPRQCFYCYWYNVKLLWWRRRQVWTGL